MKTIILAGGLGTRISEETIDKPKPMVLIDNKPILWHLMSIFASQGFDDFVIAAGYKSEVIVKWVESLKSAWKIKVLDTGLNTQTGGRIKLCMDQFPGEKVFATYGDGLANLNLNKLLLFHEMHQGLATLTAVHPPARFGVVESDNGRVTHFGEKSQAKSGWINGGFFVLDGLVANYVHAIDEPFETGAIPRLVDESQLMAYHHEGFWHPMDTLREKQDLEKMSKSGSAPWRLMEK